MLKVGLTGGIGSGKTTVAKIFSLLNIPTYFADKEAKLLMHQADVKQKIKQIFGNLAYNTNNELDRVYISNIVFKNNEKLIQLNHLIHPLVANHFGQWCNQQNAHYVIKEAAILFESEAYKQCDFTIAVIAAFDSRMQCVLQRDNITQEKFMSIVNQQISDDEKKQRADFVIYNDDKHSLISQVLAIHQQLLENT